MSCSTCRQCRQTGAIQTTTCAIMICCLYNTEIYLYKCPYADRRVQYGIVIWALFIFCSVSKALSQISFSIYLFHTIRRAKVIILFIIKSMFTLVFCLQTIKRNEPAPHLDALLGQRLLSLTLHGRSTALNFTISIVQ